MRKYGEPAKEESPEETEAKAAQALRQLAGSLNLFEAVIRRSR